MSIVAILGAGELGGATAQALAARDHFARIVLIDEAGRVAAGKALDIQQSGAVDGFHTRLIGTDDLTAVTGCHVCVVADRVGLPSSEWSGDQGLAMLTRALSYLPAAPLVFAGSSHSLLIHEIGAGLKSHRVPRHRLIGSAPEALRSAIRAIVALEAQCSPDDVMLSVLGTAPDGFVVPWSEASIGGSALVRVLPQAQLARLEARTMSLWPAGAYTLGQAAARVAEAVVTASRRRFCTFTVLGGEFGVRNRVGALPVRLAPPGIVEIQAPELDTRERVRLETALGGEPS